MAAAIWFCYGTAVGLQRRKKLRGYSFASLLDWWKWMLCKQTRCEPTLCAEIGLDYHSLRFEAARVVFRALRSCWVSNNPAAHCGWIRLVDARPCRSGWSLWLNQLAGFIRVFQEDVFMLKSVFELSWTGFHVLPRIFFFWEWQELFICQFSFLCICDAWIRQRGKKYESINLQCLLSDWFEE